MNAVFSDLSPLPPRLNLSSMDREFEEECGGPVAGLEELAGAERASSDPPPSPSKATEAIVLAAKGKSKGAAGRKVGQQYCKGCDKWLPSIDFSVNNAMCNADKRILDCIYRMAVRQNKRDWWSEHRNDEKKCRALLSDYKKATKEFEAGTAKKRWALMTYVESFSASSSTDITDHGEMMHEKVYLEFAQTARGGKLSEEQAKQQWDKWVADLDATGLLYDHNGPKNSTQFRVRICTFVDFRNEMKTQKEVQLHGKATKRPNAENVDDELKVLTLQHGKAGKTEFNLKDRASSILANASNGQAFDAHSMLIPDVTALGLQDDDVDMAVDENPESVEASSGVAESEGGKPSKRAKWWDRERAVADARSQARVACEKLRADCDAMEKTMLMKYNELQSIDPAEKVHYEAECKILRTRMVMLQHLNKTAPELQAHLSAFAQGLASASSAAGDTSGRPPSIGSAPPCMNYDKLKTISEIDKLADDFQLIDSPHSLGEHKKAIAIQRGYVLELLAACKSSAADIDKRKKQREAMKKALLGKVKNKGSGAASASTRTVAPIWEHAPSCAKEIPTLDAAAGMDVSSPCRLLIQKSFFEQQSMDIAIKGFAKLFGASNERVSEGRAQQRVAGDTAQTIRDYVKGVMPCLVWDCMSEAIKALQTPSFYGVVATYETVASERDSLACVRLGFQGSRGLILVRSLELRSFLINEVKMDADTLTQQSMFQFLKQMNADAVQSYTNSGRDMWHMTLGPLEGIYLPAGIMFVEAVYKQDCVGVRLSVLAANDQKGLKDLQQMAAEQAAKGKQTASLTEAIAVMANAAVTAATRPVGQGVGMPAASASVAPATAGGVAPAEAHSAASAEAAQEQHVQGTA